MKYPELYPWTDEDVELIWEALGISPEELLDMKEDYDNPPTTSPSTSSPSREG